MNEKFRFQKQWQEFRRRRNLQYIVVIVSLLVTNLIYFAFLKSGAKPTAAVFLLIFLSLSSVIVILSAVFYFQKWECPNCGKRFFVRSFWVRFPEFLSSCVNCNLPKYAGSTFEKN